MKTIAICFVLIMSCACMAFSQFRLVEKWEYDKLYDAYRETRRSGRIENTITKKFENESVKSTEEILVEYESAYRSKWTFSETVGNGPKATREIIYFDTRVFRREAGGDWWEVGKSARGEAGCIEIEKAHFKQYGIGTSELNGENVTYYSLQSVYDFGLYLRFKEVTTTIGSNGLVVKSLETQSNYFPRNIVESTEATYDYNTQDLVISIPDFKGIKKP